MTPRILAAALLVIGVGAAEALAQSTAPSAAAPSTAPPEMLHGTTTQNNPATASTPSPAAANGAVNVDGTETDGLSPGANSFTEDEAQSRLKGAGFGDISHLVLDRNGIWRGSADKDGRHYAVALDFKGAIAFR